MPGNNPPRAHPDTEDPSIFFRQEHIDTLERNLRDGFLFRARSGLLDKDPYEFQEVSGVRSFLLQGKRYTSGQVKDFVTNLRLLRGDARKAELGKELGQFLSPPLGGHSNSSASSPFVSTSKTRAYATTNAWAGVVVRVKVGDKINAFRNPKVSGSEDEHLVLGSVRLQDVESASVIGFKTKGNNFRPLDVRLVDDEFMVSGDGITREIAKLNDAWSDGLSKDAKLKEARLKEKARLAEELLRAKRASNLLYRNRNMAEQKSFKPKPGNNLFFNDRQEKVPEPVIRFQAAPKKASGGPAPKVVEYPGPKNGLSETRVKLPEIKGGALGSNKVMAESGVASGWQNVFDQSLAKFGNGSLGGGFGPAMKMAPSNFGKMGQTGAKAFPPLE